MQQQNLMQRTPFWVLILFCLMSSKGFRATDGQETTQSGFETTTETNDVSIPLTIQFSQIAYNLNEGENGFVIVMLLGDTNTTVTVELTTVNGIATAGEDYIPLSTTISFVGNETEWSTNISIIDDDIGEPMESFTVELRNPSSGAELMNNVATITINTDWSLEFSSNNLIVNEGEEAMVTILRTGDTLNSVTFDVSIIDETAQASIDYHPISMTISFASGETQRIITIQTIEDSLLEGSEHFTLYLFQLSETLLLTIHDTATVEISDDDIITIGFETTNYTISEEDAVDVTVALSLGNVAVVLEISVVVSTVDDRAASNDYNPLNTTIIFAVGETRKDIRISTVDDSIAEGSRAFTVELSNPSPGVMLAGSDVVIIEILPDMITIEFDPMNYTVNEGENVTFRVVLIGDTPTSDIDIDIGSIDGTAVGSMDYEIIYSSITLTAGETETVVSIQTFDDILMENTESFIVTLEGINSSSNATIRLGTRRAFVEIIDIDSMMVPEPVTNLLLDVFPSNGSVLVRWTDTQNIYDSELLYSVSINISTRGVLLYSFSYNELSFGRDSPDFSFSSSNSIFAVNGVVIDASVQASNIVGDGMSVDATTTIPGVFAPMVQDLVATARDDVLAPSVTLEWNNRFQEVPPDRFVLNYSVNRLSASETLTEVSEFSVNLTQEELNSSLLYDYAYTLSNLLFYATYEFQLIAVYGTDESDPVTVLNTTSEGHPPIVEIADSFGVHRVEVETRDGVSGTISLSFIIQDTYPPVHEDDIIWTYINATSGETVDVKSELADLDERFSISSDSEHGIHTLSILFLQLSDSGVYSLTASNGIGNSTASINLTVHVEPILLSMTVLDEMDTFDEGQSTSFSCTADGFPPPIIVWLHNGTLIDTNLQQRFSTNVDLVGSNRRPHVPQATTSTLLVRDLHLRDSGEYICRADPPVTGQSDVAMTPIILRVEAQPIDYCVGMPCMNGGRCVSLEDGFLCECIEDKWRGVMCETAVIRDEPAKVVLGPEDSFAQFFTSVNLTCDVTGSPQPEITWYKDDELLEGQRLSYLFIDEVELSDRGMYYCVASNTIQDPENPSVKLEHQDQSDPVVLNINGVIQYISILNYAKPTTQRKRQTEGLQSLLSLLSAQLSGVNISGSDATVYSVTTTSQNEMDSEAVSLLITLLSPNGGDSVVLEQLQRTLNSAAMIEELVHFNFSFASIERFDGCPADTTVLPALSDDGTPVILDWPEVDLGVNYTLQCPCGNLYAIGGDVNRKAYRFCGGDFTTGATWSPPIQQACNFSEVTRQLCQVSNLIGEPEEAIITLENITSNEEQISALEVGITAVLLESLTDAVVVEENIVLSENLLAVVDNILDVEGDQLQHSQEESNSSAMILDVLGRVAESVPIPENKTEVIIPLRSFAVSVREIEPESFTGLTFSALLGDSFDFSQKDENIDANSLVFDQQETRPTASISIPEDIFGSLTTSFPNMNTTTTRRIVHSVYLTDSLFGRREESEFQVGSIVISAAISGGVKVEGLENPIMMQFIKSPDVANGTQTMCNFWDIQADYGFGNWSGRGCWVVNETEEDVTCACDHLTNFAILLDVSPDNTTQLPDELAKTLLAVSYIGAILSIILLTLTIITYLSVQKLRSSVPGQLLINLCLALIGIYVMFIVAYYLTTVTVKLQILCAVAGGLLQYFMLVTFSIMAAEAVIVYIKFVKVFGCTAIQHRYVIKTALISWIVPLVIVIVSLGPNYRNYIGEQICRPYNLPFYVGLIAPFLAVYVFIWIMFLIIFISLLKRHLQRKEVDVSIKTGNRKAKQQFLIAVTLSLLFGLGWGFGLPATNRISSVPLRTVLQAIFIFVTAFHGVFVFVMQCARQQEARNEWKRWFNVVICCRRLDKACAFSLKLPRSYDGDTLPGLYSKTSTMSTIPSKEPNNTVVFENEGSKYPSSDYSKNTTHISCTEATCTV